MAPVKEQSTPPRSRGFIAGGAVVAALIVAGVGLSIGAAFNEGARPGGGATRATRTMTPPTAGGSTCGLTGMDPAGAELTAAPETQWITVGTMAAPTSPTAGPGRTRSNGLRSCYSHTITGAVFAAANTWAMGSDPRLYRQVLARNTATGPGRTAALEQAVGASNTGMSAQIAGFKVTSYTPAEATIDIVFRLSTGTQISFPAPVKWQHGDWKVELADDGTPVFRPTALQTLTGYTPWASTE